MSVASTIDSLNGLEFSSYLYAAAVSLVVFDWLLSFDAEVKHVWNVPWNLGRILYIVTRYLVFIDASLILYHGVGHSLSTSTCDVLFKVIGYMQTFGIVWAEVILTIRVWALWGRGRKMGIFVVIVSLLNSTLGIVGYAFLGPSYTFIAMDSISPTTLGCFYTLRLASLSWVVFTALTVHLTFIFTMTMIKGIQHHRTMMRGAALTRTFYADGVIYYLVLQVLSVINLIISLSPPAPVYINMLTSIQRVFHSILSARILLHLWEESEALREMVSESGISIQIR